MGEGQKGAQEGILVVRDVDKRFGQKQVLKGVSLEIFPGEIFGIIGVSGVGKTTLLELLIGFLKSDKGEVLFRSGEALGLSGSSTYRSVIEEQRKFKGVFGFAAQSPSFYGDLTIEENLRYFGSLYGLSRRSIEENITTLLNLVGLSENRKAFANELSGGMQKRLDIACAMIHNPKILILDEPTADLDILLRKQMWDLVRDINRKGTTVLISSHFLDEIETLCNRIVLLHNQGVLWQGSVKELKNTYAKSEEIHLETEPGDYAKVLAALKEKKLSILNAEIDGDLLIIYASEADLVLHHLIHILEKLKEKIIDVELRRPSLSDVFESLTKRT